MKIGPYEIQSVHTGYLSLDGGAMFGTIPRVLWQTKVKPDSEHRIRLAMRAMLIRGEGKVILVDCGLGDKGNPKFRTMFAVDQSEHNLDRSLAARGLSRADVTHVILTHLHFDHAGAATSLMHSEQGDTYVPTFSNARYYVQKQNLNVAKHPNRREKASYLPEIYQALEASGKLTELEGELELFSGIHLIVSQGHTEAQQLVVVSDEQTGVVYGGDLIPTRHHISLPWVMGYDLRPLQLMDEKEKLLAKACVNNWCIFFEHDDQVEGAFLAKGERDFEIKSTAHF